MKRFSDMLDEVCALRLKEFLSGKTKQVSFALNDFENSKGLPFVFGN